MRYKNSFRSLLGAVAMLLCVASGVQAQTPTPTPPPPTNAQLLDQLLATAKEKETTVQTDDMVLSIDKLRAYRAQFEGGGDGTNTPYQTDLWSGGNVPYEFDPTLKPAERNAFIRAARRLEFAGNFKFSPRTTQTDYVRVLSTENNQVLSSIGRVGGAQDMVLAPVAPALAGTPEGDTASMYAAMHLIMHTLGVMHEHGRFDRDRFITIDFTNVVTARQPEYAIIDNGFNRGSYDLDSLMHAGQYDAAIATTRPSVNVDSPNQGRQRFIGQRTRLSNGDSQGLQDLYGFQTRSQPSNDFFSNARRLSGPSGSVGGSVFFASSENGEKTQSGNQARTTIWYRWTPSRLGPVVFDTLNSEIDTYISVYLGTGVSTLTEVASNDDRFPRNPTVAPATPTNFTAISSRVEFPAQAGATYYIAVNSAQDFVYKSGDVGDIRLNWNQTEDNARYRIGGAVKTNFSPVQGVGAVTISLTGADTGNSATTATTTTNDAGEYTFANILPGNYTLRPSKTGFRFDPQSLRVNLSTSDSTTNNFTGIALPVAALPEVYISDVTSREGNAGNTFLTFSVSLNVAAKETIVISFATSNGTANSTSDYKGIKGTLTFAPGVTTVPIDVGLRPDRVSESAESFTVKISADGTRVKVVKEIGTATIIDDDVAPTSGSSARSAKIQKPTRVAVRSTHRA